MNNTSSETLVLAGDIGGTKTNLGLYEKGRHRPLLKTMQTYSSRDASGLEEIIDQFLKKTGVAVSRA